MNQDHHDMTETDALIDPRWKGKRVAVAMSGGVDSSVAAVLCAQAGCEVVGITLKLWDFESVGGDTKRDGRCCTVESFDACRAIAAQHGFAHYAIDLQRQFNDCVIANFVDEYRKGRTPNPCVVCNTEIKWGALWEKARAYGCEAMVTGHYAQLQPSDDGSINLVRGIDASRDQSYFLWGIEPELLSHTLFPLGGLTKVAVRELARTMGLVNAETPESRDICFVDDGNLARFLAERGARDGQTPASGKIVDGEGQELGQHDGVEAYTIGQRRGLGLSLGRPQYITEIDPESATVTVGDNEDLFFRRFRVREVNWLTQPPSGQFAADVQIRYGHTAAPATISTVGATEASITFAEPQRAITPGQSAAFYDGSRLLGGGIVDVVERD